MRPAMKQKTLRKRRGQYNPLALLAHTRRAPHRYKPDPVWARRSLASCRLVEARKNKPAAVACRRRPLVVMLENRRVLENRQAAACKPAVVACRRRPLVVTLENRRVLENRQAAACKPAVVACRRRPLVVVMLENRRAAANKLRVWCKALVTAIVAPVVHNRRSPPVSLLVAASIVPA